MKRRKLIHIIIAMFILLTVLTYPVSYYYSLTDVDIKVIKSERITYGSGKDMSSKYLIYTDNEVFEDTDSWIFWKFTSSDYYTKLKSGQKYKIRVAGWRIPFFSLYRNIITIKQIN